MKRRTFLWTPLCLSFGSLMSPVTLARLTSIDQDQTRSACAPLLSCFSNKTDAAEVGYRYLKGRPELADTARLMRDVGLPQEYSNLSSQSANDHFNQAKRHDFTVGNTLCVEGWVLSKAEVSLCALAYLCSINV